MHVLSGVFMKAYSPPVFFGRLAALAICNTCLFLMPANADDRLLGSWFPANIPVTVPAGASLTISRLGESYIGSASAPFTVPAPVGCQIGPETELVRLTPISKNTFSANFVALTPISCSPIQVDSFDLEITFANDTSSFIACQSNGRCSSWIRVGAAPEKISSKTVPAKPTLTAAKAAIAVFWDSLPGVVSYKISLAGPIKLTKTVKRGNTVKFNKLPKGTYAVTMSGIFKDAAGKLSSTRTTKSVKIKL